MPEGASPEEGRLTPSSRAEAEAWALVLAAEGVAHRLVVSDGRYAIGVAGADQVRAVGLIARWADENTEAALPPAEPEPDIPTNAGIWIALALIAFFYVTGAWSEESEYFRRGTADARRILSGELWRTVTALSLHSDPAHVLGNAFSCAVFGTLLLRRWGVGVGAWLLLASGALGNLLTALWHGSHYRSVGASTALFGAIGALAATEFVRRRRLRLGWNKAWLPIAGGLGLLAMLGTGRGSDFTAHWMGLCAGVVLGALAARSLATPPAPSAQAALTLAALGAIGIAWAAALG
jgi:membrane associated rhomboid family serine protease